MKIRFFCLTPRQPELRGPEACPPPDPLLPGGEASRAIINRLAIAGSGWRGSVSDRSTGRRIRRSARGRARARPGACPSGRSARSGCDPSRPAARRPRRSRPSRRSRERGLPPAAGRSQAQVTQGSYRKGLALSACPKRPTAAQLRAASSSPPTQPSRHRRWSVTRATGRCGAGCRHAPTRR